MWRWPVSVVRFLLEYSDLVLVWTGIALWEHDTKTRLSAETHWILYGGGCAVISFWNWHKATARAEAAEAATKAAAEKSEPPARSFAQWPEALLAQLRDPKTLTAMQVVPYYDKWITIAGRVDCNACGFVTLILDRGQRVNIRFDAGQESKLQDARKGQYLTAICQIRPAYSHSRVALENGEVVQLAPYRAQLARVS
jgi:hypothetical protein